MSTERERESDPPPNRGKFSAWVVLLAFGGGFILGGGGLGAFGLYRARQAEQAAAVEERRAKEAEAQIHQAMLAENQARQESLAASRELWDGLDAMVRDEFKQPRPRSHFAMFANGITEENLTTRFGKPDATEVRDGETCWVYVGRTINPETKMPDRKAVVRFRDGKVADVTFE